MIACRLKESASLYLISLSVSGPRLASSFPVFSDCALSSGGVRARSGAQREPEPALEKRERGNASNHLIKGRVLPARAWHACTASKHHRTAAFFSPSSSLLPSGLNCAIRTWVGGICVLDWDYSVGRLFVLIWSASGTRRQNLCEFCPLPS